MATWSWVWRAEELVGIPSVDGHQAVGPEVGQLSFAQIAQGAGSKLGDAFDQGDTQHLRVGPKLADGQRVGGLVGI
jgi:hypothetical protein